jgi:stearoyl-CoA desaturase (delta-9 desaturase)
MMASAVVAPPRRRRSKKQAQRKIQQRVERTLAPQEVYDWFNPNQLNWKNIDWVTLVWMVAIHAGCLAAPFFFTWEAIGIALVAHWLTASVGVCLGYHRYLSHKSLKLTRPAEFVVLFCSVASGQGSPLMWSATHRLHHQRSDQEGDPHSPLEGGWWSHILWLFVNHTPEQRALLYRRYIPDLVDRPIMQFYERFYGVCLIGIAVALYAIAGLPGVLWGVCVRMTWAYHCTWFVNSATHLWGYRNYDTRDESRNLWWVALIAFGEGWHNNHHAHPHTARAGHRWWEIDTTWWLIRGLRAVGLATEVDDRIPLDTKPDESLASA